LSMGEENARPDLVRVTTIPSMSVFNVATRHPSSLSRRKSRPVRSEELPPLVAITTPRLPPRRSAKEKDRPNIAYATGCGTVSSLAISFSSRISTSSTCATGCSEGTR
jgi:hypothetical protein